MRREFGLSQIKRRRIVRPLKQKAWEGYRKGNEVRIR